ncbi:hypothetical protein [Flavobacterium sp. H4147]|uniref:hypothetical protein n=1 Tax=Flavobacterium sp. H4147 TaxID=3034149 RepID=UPI0023EC049D|nr:hypothetical protein [Flavobacterium sp. H4147]
MDFFSKKSNPDDENRLRLQKLVDQTIKAEVPTGWKKETFAIGGLNSVGFSKKNPEMLLVVSSQGRGLIDCSKFELIERDYDDSWDWMNTYELWTMGIGKLSDEKIAVGGVDGGGLPFSNKFGDSIEFMATQWPIIDLIFSPNYKSIYLESETQNCFRIFHDYELKAYGFSYDGNYFTTATSSEVNIYRRLKNEI